MNLMVSSDIGPPPLKAIRSRPPVASFSFLNTTASRMPAPGKPDDRSICLRDMAPQNMFLTMNEPALTFARMPFLTLSHTAGTPIRIVGRNSRMSPLQFRTEVSDRVLGLPYPIVPPQNKQTFSNMYSKMCD